MPPLPRGCDLLWSVFQQLHNARSSAGMGGPGAITWQDVVAWQQGNQVQLTPWEIDTVFALDPIALKAMTPDSKPGK